MEVAAEPVVQAVPAQASEEEVPTATKDDAVEVDDEVEVTVYQPSGDALLERVNVARTSRVWQLKSLCVRDHPCKMFLDNAELADLETLAHTPAQLELTAVKIGAVVDYAGPSRLLSLPQLGQSNLSVAALICVPPVSQFLSFGQANRVGVIFGNHTHAHGCGMCFNLEMHGRGQIRLWFYCGKVDIYGTTDLRDGLKHTVGFTWDGTKVELFVDGRIEAMRSVQSEPLQAERPFFVGRDWREGGMSFRGDILRLWCFDRALANIDGALWVAEDVAPCAVYTAPSPQCTLASFDDCEDGFTLIATVQTAQHLDLPGRVGVIFGNHTHARGCNRCFNLELHNRGQIRLWWNCGSTDIFGTTDLRDGKRHVTGFIWRGSTLEVFVDGEVEAKWDTCAPLPLAELRPFLVGSDWRQGGMGFRGTVLSVQAFPCAIHVGSALCRPR